MTLVINADRQRILDAEGHVLVTGGPGCGKTTIALAKAEQRIKTGLEPGQSILFLSFSRAAVARVIEASKFQLPRESQSRLSIQTFHSFFWEIIRAYGYLLGAPRRLRLLLPQDERAIRNGAEDEDEGWHTERERLFRESGLVAFDLFAPKAHELLERSKRIRKLFASRHPLIVVDEAQDTAEDQWHSVRLLAELAQLVCLADLDQQIYDFRPGVTAERLTQIVTALDPLRVDLRSENHRSPGSEIVTFGNDVLLSTPRGAAYQGVSRLMFHPDKARRDGAIRRSVGMIFNQVRTTTGEAAKNIAVLASWGRGVNIITKALTGNTPERHIPHRVLIDEAPVLLASRLVAFLLEPKTGVEHELSDLAGGLTLAASVYRSRGGRTSLAQAQRLLSQADQARTGVAPKAHSISAALLGVLRRLKTHLFSGDPKRDWLDTRRFLSESGVALWSEVAAFAEQLVAFRRGQHITSALTELWQDQGHYGGAREALDTALAQDQLLSGGNDLHGIHVMTLHKSKGKEFDGVVILDDSNNSPLIYCKEKKPYPRSRKLLRVGITRARYHVVLLVDLYNPSPLLDGHRL